MTKFFSDYLTATAQKNQSVLCAGFDPSIEHLPKVFIDEATATSTTNEQFYEKVFFSFYSFCLEHVSSKIACIKPNIAFFEQYGIGALVALQKILKLSRDLKIPSVLDCKRGDIGSTAESYVKAYLTGVSSDYVAFDADSITVNPFLGFDTAQTFLKGAADSGKGLFFLVKTSNPGSKDLQDLTCGETTISEKIADWIADNAGRLTGQSGLSGVGAVVGATHPDHLKALRKRMPTALFLIPGYGAQGGKASDLASAFTSPFQGAVINASRGLLSAFSNLTQPKELLAQELLQVADNLVAPLNQATQARG